MVTKRALTASLVFGVLGGIACSAQQTPSGGNSAGRSNEPDAVGGGSVAPLAGAAGTSVGTVQGGSGGRGGSAGAPPSESPECDGPMVSPFASRTDIWGYELVPSVIAPGESFVIEIQVPPSVLSSLKFTSAKIPDRTGADTLEGPPGFRFSDDGVAPDRAPNDNVWTLGPLTIGASALLWERSSGRLIADLDFSLVGDVVGSRLNGEKLEFAIQQTLGILRNGSGLNASVERGNIRLTNHLAEISTPGWQVQSNLRSIAKDTCQLTQALYDLVQDDVDHWVFFSTQHLEFTHKLSPANTTAGSHESAWIEASGGGYTAWDLRAQYGSKRLRSVNVVDHGNRGINALNVTHEILHTWGVGLDPVLGLGSLHYASGTSVGSLLGGIAWDPVGNGAYRANCNEGPSGATQASPLDLYFMGLIAADEVPVQRVQSQNPDTAPACGALIPKPYREVTVAEIIDRHGPVIPGPDKSQKHYRVGFAIEVPGRALTPTEREFYHRLAEAYTAPLAPDEFPRVATNWVSIAKFFGHGSEWQSDLSAR